MPSSASSAFTQETLRVDNCEYRSQFAVARPSVRLSVCLSSVTLVRTLLRYANGQTDTHRQADIQTRSSQYFAPLPRPK